MKMKYINPEMEIVLLDETDIITTSGDGNANGSPGSSDDGNPVLGEGE